MKCSKRICMSHELVFLFLFCIFLHFPQIVSDDKIQKSSLMLRHGALFRHNKARWPSCIIFHNLNFHIQLRAPEGSSMAWLSEMAGRAENLLNQLDQVWWSWLLWWWWWWWWYCRPGPSDDNDGFDQRNKMNAMFLFSEVNVYFFFSSWAYTSL